LFQTNQGLGSIFWLISSSSEAAMARYILRRILISIPVLLGITLITFFLLHASGDPMAVYASNPSISAED